MRSLRRIRQNKCLHSSYAREFLPSQARRLTCRSSFRVWNDRPAVREARLTEHARCFDQTDNDPSRRTGLRLTVLYKGSGRFRPPSLGTRSTGPAGPRPARSCKLRPVRNPATHERTPTQTLPLSASANRVHAHLCFLFSDREKLVRHFGGWGVAEKASIAPLRRELSSIYQSLIGRPFSPILG
jgi:hypothetical protein